MTLLRAHVPLPAALTAQGVTDQSFYNDLVNGGAQYGQAARNQPFDPVAFVKDFEERYSGPLKSAQALFDRFPYLTRLFSTVSPDEMTRDPLFVFNPSLPQVARERKARARGRCNGGEYRDLFFMFENGETLAIPGPLSFGSWPAPDRAPVYAKRADEKKVGERSTGGRERRLSVSKHSPAHAASASQCRTTRLPIGLLTGCADRGRRTGDDFADVVGLSSSRTSR